MHFGASRQYAIHGKRGDLPRNDDLMIIRPLTLCERESVRSFYLALTPEDRRKRFCCTLSDATLSKYVDRLKSSRSTYFESVASDSVQQKRLRRSSGVSAR